VIAARSLREYLRLAAVHDGRQGITMTRRASVWPKAALLASPSALSMSDSAIGADADFF